jgi:tetratricopeptide (TPR) repeat protein
VTSPTISAAPRKTGSGPKSSPARERLAPKLDLEKEQARTKKELLDRLERVRAQNHYELLGVSRRAPADEIRDAMEAVVGEYNPERVLVGPASREVRALAETIYLTVFRAYDVLMDPDAREAYDREIGDASAMQRIAPLAYAEDLFHRGKRAGESGQWDIARELYREATEMSPQEGTYVAHLALATFCAEPKNETALAKATALFDRAVALSPRVEEIYLLRGTMYQRVGQRAEAIRDFEAAVRANPDSVEALRALRALEPPSARKSSLLSRLIES